MTNFSNGESQQQILRVSLGGIHVALRYAINYPLDRLGPQYLRTKDGQRIMAISNTI
jgi:hypothetical protein